MKILQFLTCKEFYIDTNGWGVAQPLDIVRVLESVVNDFYCHFDNKLITNKSVIVTNSNDKSPKKDNPEIIKYDHFNLIYLQITDTYWCQYSYQFAHELCHHVIDSDFFTTIDKFGWFEEALCELASIFCLDKMSLTWQTNPPYPDPSWTNYSKVLADYNKDIIGNAENNILKPFKIWLNENLDKLFKERYKRRENRIIALQLYPLFKIKTELWMTIQYLKLVKVTDEMTFENFMDEWEEVVPANLTELLKEIKMTLIDEKASS